MFQAGAVEPSSARLLQLLVGGDETCAGAAPVDDPVTEEVIGELIGTVGPAFFGPMVEGKLVGLMRFACRLKAPKH